MTHRIGLPATGQQDFLSKCNDVAGRVRAHAQGSSSRLAWWMDEERVQLRTDSTWCSVFDHLANSHLGLFVVANASGVSK